MPVYFSLFFVCGALLVALTVYVLTGGADYGGGVWDLLASGPRAAAQRQLIERAIGPIWEADHVWLILVIVILFDAFPPAFAAIMIAMHIPVTLMLVGIVLRGSAFSFRSYGGGLERTQIRWDRMFSIASLVTPILLGVIIGAVASGRIPKDPRRFGDFVWPWMTPFCFAVGVFALALFAYLAAIYATLEPCGKRCARRFSSASTSRRSRGRGNRRYRLVTLDSRRTANLGGVDGAGMDVATHLGHLQLRDCRSICAVDATLRDCARVRSRPSRADPLGMGVCAVSLPAGT